MSQKKPAKPAKAKKASKKKAQKEDASVEDLSDLGRGASFEMKPFLAVMVVTVACAMMLWNSFNVERAVSQQSAISSAEGASADVEGQPQSQLEDQSRLRRGLPPLPCEYEGIIGQPITRGLVDGLKRSYRVYEVQDAKPRWEGKVERMNLGVERGIITEIWCG